MASANVHGIGVDELQQSPPFAVVFERFLFFLRDAADSALALAMHDESEDELESPKERRCLQSPAPDIVLAAHNCFRYDGPVIVHECVRHGVALHP